MSNYESHWRQALHDYTPTATDADWAAMRAQLPDGKPRGGASPWWWVVVLLLFVGAGTQVRWDRAAAPALVDTLPIETDPPAARSLTLVTPPTPVSVSPPVATELVGTSSSQVPPPAGKIAGANTLPPILNQDIGMLTPRPTTDDNSSATAALPLPTLPVTPVRASTYIAEQLDGLGKSLIVVPPPRGRWLPASDNGFYPPIHSRKH